LGEWPNCFCKTGQIPANPPNNAVNNTGANNNNVVNAPTLTPTNPNTVKENTFSLAKRFESLNKQCASHAFTRELFSVLKKKIVSHIESNNNSIDDIYNVENSHSILLQRYNLLIKACDIIGFVSNLLQHCCIGLYYTQLDNNNQRELIELNYNELNECTQSVVDSAEELAKNHRKLNYANKFNETDLDKLNNKGHAFYNTVNSLLKQK
jgi:hypothetical protein